MATLSQKGSQAGKSQMSDARRERLLDIQKREQLKGLLVNKFKVNGSVARKVIRDMETDLTSLPILTTKCRSS